MVVAAMLEQVTGETGTPLFLVKGGTAIELRRPDRRRATRDLDLSLTEDIADIRQALDQVLRQEWGDFSLDLKRSEERSVGGLRVVGATIAISYRGKHWLPIELEISQLDGKVAEQPERVQGFSLEHLELEGPKYVSCLPLAQQVAQKLHACTEPTEANDRVRDVLDLLLVEDLIRQRLSQTRDACEEVFSHRASHPWPPPIKARENWEAEFASIADEAGYHTDSLTVAAERLRNLVEEIQNS